MRALRERAAGTNSRVPLPGSGLTLRFIYKAQAKNGNYGPVVGPLRVVVVYGGAPEGAGGQCSKHTFPALNCVFNGSGTSFKCK